MKYKGIRITLLASLILFHAGCSQAGELTLPAGSLPQPITTALVVSTQTETEPNGTQMTPSVQTSASSGMESLIEWAKKDLAQRLSVSIDQISLVEARAVVWPDASLGCPQPGMRYKQVPEDGALIVLQAQGSVYEYHNGGTRGLFLCEKGFLKTEKPPQLDITDLTPDTSIPPDEDQ